MSFAILYRSGVWCVQEDEMEIVGGQDKPL